MIKQTSLGDVLQRNLHFELVDSRGFHCLKCQVCNDYKVRAGFKIESDVIGYNCWNCGASFRYEEDSGHMSKNARKILSNFGIDETEISSVINSSFFHSEKKTDEKITLKALEKINTQTPTIQLPPLSFKLGEHSDHLDYQLKLVMYLEKRKIDITKYPFFYSLEARYINRIIIPFYRQGKLIYWQGRAVDDSENRRFENAMVPREAVMFNMDELTAYSKAPLFVTEGAFDALIVNGLALAGSKLTPAKLELLSKTKRRLIFVIDKDKNGAALARDVLDRGWEITFVPNGADDINKCAQRFGVAWTIVELFKNIPKTPSETQLAIKMNCKQ